MRVLHHEYLLHHIQSLRPSRERLGAGRWRGGRPFPLPFCLLSRLSSSPTQVIGGWKSICNPRRRDGISCYGRGRGTPLPRFVSTGRVEEENENRLLAAGFLTIQEHQARMQRTGPSPWSLLYGFRVNGPSEGRTIAFHASSEKDAHPPSAVVRVQVKDPSSFHPAGMLAGPLFDQASPLYSLHLREEMADNLEKGVSSLVEGKEVGGAELLARVDGNGLFHYRWSNSDRVEQVNVTMLPSSPLSNAQIRMERVEGSHSPSLDSPSTERSVWTAFLPSSHNYGSVQREIEQSNPEAMNPLITSSSHKHTNTSSSSSSSLASNERIEALIQGRPGKTLVGLVFAEDPNAEFSGVDISASMNGKIVKIDVAEGCRVEKGDPVVVLEAMKMESVLRTTVSGTVGPVRVRPGDAVKHHQVLFTIVPDTENNMGKKEKTRV